VPRLIVNPASENTNPRPTQATTQKSMDELLDECSNEAAKVLFERRLGHVVTYAPSSTTLYLLRSKELVGKRPKALLAVGGVPYSHSGMKRKVIERGYTPDQEFEDLPNSEPEASAAAFAMRNPENKELKGTAATETNLKQAFAQEFGYIHLAVHAFSSDNPDRASLVVLSDPSSGEDGFVQASEIVQMQLPAS
jgi:CHAT domain-containing protein